MGRSNTRNGCNHWVRGEARKKVKRSLDKFKSTNRFTRKPVKEAPVEWWEEYIETRSDESRNRLIVHYLKIVDFHAEKFATKVPASVSVDDLKSAATVGMIDAMKRYDPHGKANFKTFSDRRIHGSIVDHLRKLDWVPRLVRENGKKLDATRDYLRSVLMREPSDFEMAARLKVGLVQYRKMVRGGTPIQLNSLSDNWQDDKGGKDVTTLDILPDKAAREPCDGVDRCDSISAIFEKLTPQETFITQLYYFADMTMRQIGEVLDLSESRVCQIHARILKRTRERFPQGVGALA